MSITGGCIFKSALVLFLFVLSVSKVKCVAVMSVDIGVEWMKVAIVSVSIR